MTDDPVAAAEMGPWLSLALGKTEAGRREITERALPLSRSARNLLFSIDAQRSAGQWLELVRGSGPVELRLLLAAGLISRAPGGSGSAPASAGMAAAAAVNPAVIAVIASPIPAAAAPSTAADPTAVAVAHGRLSPIEGLQVLSYRLLYDRLTAEARQQLGLIKGYKLILDIEKCVDPPELRALALRFVEQVRQAKGDAAAHTLAQRLADPG